MANRLSFGDSYWRLDGPTSYDLRQLSPNEVDQAEYKGLADNLPTLCWIANADGYIIWYNRRWHEYCGTTPEEMEGWGWQAVHDPHALPAVMEKWTGSIASGEPFEMVFPLKGADGIFRPFLTRIVPIRDGAGVPQRWIGNNVDISEQHRIEQELRRSQEELRELNRTLEMRVEERAALHQATAEQLRQSQKLEAIGQLTGGVAHDFNNLLTVIRGSVDILRREGLTDDKRARYMDAIGVSADRAAALTGQLLAFARRQALKPEMFDAGSSLSEVAEMMRTLVGPHIELDIQVPDEPCFILADRSQFDTTLINLGVNARDAMGGEGRLRMTTGPVSGIPEIRAHQAIAGDFIAVTVSDTGSGITPEIAERIFEPFFTTKDVGKGTGLGLSQAFGFVKQSGGDIRVESVEGEGTTFTLYLPRTYQEGHEHETDITDHAPIDGDGLCVLLVEDNEQVGEFATEALKELGYESFHAVDATSALEELNKDSSRFHVVFSDVVMPGMSGIELGQEIRRLYPNLPVVLTSGYSHVLAQNGQHGFELLHKPYSVEQLSRVLHKAVVWRAGRRGLQDQAADTC